jgi:lipopolysaccharide heptosyltransferase I
LQVSKVLIIKTSSLGDIIHTLPAITEAKKAFPHIQFDWLVDESFKEIPAWHPAIRTVIPIPLRQWRKKGWQAFWQGDIQRVLKHIRAESYDKVIDAQGLLKSALLTWFCRGERVGLSFSSAREPLASIFYQKKCVVPNYKKAHAILRTRSLFAKSLGYVLKDNTEEALQNISYGLDKVAFQQKPEALKPYCVFLHGTTWSSKLWPESYWRELSTRLHTLGFEVQLPRGNAVEYEAAKRIQGNASHVHILPQSSLSELVPILANAKAVVSVDTGLGHLSAALSVPTIALFGSTDPALTSPIGPYQKTLSAEFACAPCLSRTCTYKGVKTIDPPCFSALSPTKVFTALMQVLNTKTQESAA